MLTILTGKDNKILRTPATAVETFDQKLADTVDLMIQTMLNPGGQEVTGIGLAAPQVGIGQQIMVMTLNVNSKKEGKILIMINPQIIEQSSATCKLEEGCLSLPGAYSEVERPTKVKVKWQNLKGHWCERRFEKWDARIFLHEFDHLQGILFIDHLSKESYQELQKKNLI